jgi:putative membrane protein
LHTNAVLIRCARALSGLQEARIVEALDTVPSGEKHSMFRALIHWLLSAIALMAATHLVAGFYVNDLQAALIAALVIGVLNATLGFVLKVITFPFAIVTFGIFLLVINAAMILLASKIVPGFLVYGWVPAFWAAAILAVVGMLIRAVMKDQ